MRLRAILSKDGIVCFAVPGSTVYLADEAAALDSGMLNTAGTVFPYIKVIPDIQTIVMASSRPFETNSELLLERFRRFSFKTDSISRQLIQYKIEPKKETVFLRELTNFAARKHAPRMLKNPINSDWRPAAVKDCLIYIYSIAERASGKILGSFFDHVWIVWVVLAVWFLYGRVGVLGTSFTSGTAGIALQIISMIALQVVAGNIFSLMGISNAAFMAGIALGSIVFSRFEHFLRVRDIEIIFVIWAGLWLALFSLNAITLFLAFILSFGTGFLVGFEFPALTASRKRFHADPESVSASKVYAWDLLGGCAGALIIGVVTIPSLGILGTLLCIVAMKLISARWWLKSGV